MPKLIGKLEADNYSSYSEDWALANDLLVEVIFGKKGCEVTFRSQTGDVTDQIYNIFQEQNQFLESKLTAISCYMIEIASNDVMPLLEAAEKIDVKSLKQGKTY